MKAERLFRAIGLVDEGLIEAAAETPAKKRPVWRRYAAAAACLMVLCGAGAAYLVTGGFRGHGASAGGSGINNADSAADTAVFMSYIDISTLNQPGIYNVEVSCWVKNNTCQIVKIQPSNIKVKISRK